VSTSSTPRDFHALVTGATGGIGRGVCDAIADRARTQGHSLRLSVAASRAGAKLDTLAAELRAAAIETVPLAGDVTDPAACRAIVEQAVAHGGDLHALVCVAGSSKAAALADLDVAQWNQTFALNVRSVWLMAQAARASLARTRGSITAVASMSGVQPHPGLGAYSPAKAALIMLCRQLAQEWAHEGIRTNCVCPGMIRTPLTEAIYHDAATLQRRESLVPLGRIGTAYEVGQAVAYLASAAASYVNGANLLVDGGVSEHMLAMIPGRPGAVSAPADPARSP
jgi:3-oxoacyl-[acyl-carrier protein] reductase